MRSVVLELRPTVVETTEEATVVVNVPPESVTSVQLGLALLSLGVIDPLKFVNRDRSARSVCLRMSLDDGGMAGQIADDIGLAITVEKRSLDGAIESIAQRRADGIHGLDTGMRAHVEGRAGSVSATLILDLRIPPGPAWAEPGPPSECARIEAAERQIMRVLERLTGYPGARQARVLEGRLNECGSADHKLPENARSIAEALDLAPVVLGMVLNRLRERAGSG